MQGYGLIFFTLCILNVQNIYCEIKLSVLENIPIRGLLFNESVKDDSSGYSNESGSGYEDSDFGYQLQVPTDSKDNWEEDTTKFGSGNGKGDEGPSGKGLFEPGNDDDLYIESSGDSQLETQPFDHTSQPVTKHNEHVHPLTRRPLVSVHREGHAFSQCENNKCTRDHHHDVKIVSTGGNVLPSSVMMVIHCTVHSYANDSVSLTWFGLSDIDSMWNQSNENLEIFSNKERTRTAVSVLRLYNISESDSGVYGCKAVFSERCCYRNATINVKVYTPPSISTDIAIVLAVCFIELILIMYFKTRSEKKCKNTRDRSSLPYKELRLVQSKT